MSSLALGAQVAPSWRPGSSRGPARPRQRRAPDRLTRRGRAVVAALLGLVLAGSYAAGTMRTGGQVYVPSESVVVHQGDTLWSLAAERTAPGQDVRQTIQLIQRLNQLAGPGLMAGDRLWLPRLGQ